MNKFIKSTIILVIGGLITKVLGMVIKVIVTRLLGTEGIGIYMLTMPTYTLFIALAQLGMPIAISKLVSENKRNNKNLLFSAFPIALIVNVLIFIFLLLSSKFIAVNLLHEERCYYTLLSIGFVLPFISISSILRGYFFGKQRVFPHVFSNTIEDIVRLITLIIGIPIFLFEGLEYAIAFVLLSNIISELASIITLLLFVPNKFKIKKEDIIPNVKNIEDVLSISLPSTASRIIGSIGYFFEPIILTYVLLNIGYSNSYIINEYGIINGYVLPLLLLPSFFTGAISQALLPIVSTNYVKGNYEYIKNKIKQAINISLLIGIPVTLFFVFFPQIFLNIIYDTDLGTNYIRILAPIFLLHYIQSPLIVSLQAIGKAKDALIGTIIGIVLRVAILFGFSYLKIGLYGLIIASSFNIIFSTLYDYTKVSKALKKT